MREVLAYIQNLEKTVEPFKHVSIHSME